jgi:DNA repair protein RadC
MWLFVWYYVFMFKVLKICERPVHQRPRERILTLGSAHMSDAELLALLLSTGSGKEDAISLAHRVLRLSGGLRQLKNWSPEKLMEIHGIGPAKASQIMGLTALFQRFQEELRVERPRITGPQDLIPLFKDQIKDREREVFAVAFLDAAHQLIAIEELFEGGINYASVSPRVVATRALDRRASAVVVFHNHPSGQAKASVEDEILTKRLKEALNFLEIRLLDHILVAADDCVSVSSA